MPGIQVVGPKVAGEEKILTTEALDFVEKLARNFGGRRLELLRQRQWRKKDLDKGVLPNFIAETKWIRDGNWKIDPAPADLQDRRVEITGPADQRGMVVRAANSGASCYMADAEDSVTPTKGGVIAGQCNLFDLIRRQIDFDKDGKQYRLNEKTAVLFFRPRGWHLDERHVLLGETSISASLFDFGMYFFHNAKALMERGTGVYVYLPKMESRHEARLWKDVFDFAETWFKLPTGSIRATVLIETILAAFEMDEILYELRHHSAGLNCGRWDYIFSYIKKLCKHARFVLPERGQLTMDKGFLAAYVQLLIQTCHKRGAHAMGGMAAQIPNKKDPVANDEAMLKVKADKAREVQAGHDGTWVAHPDLVEVAKEIFDLGMPGPNQLQVLREDVHVTAEDLLRVPGGEITDDGVHHNIRVGIQYLESWLRGVGCVQLNNLMEDAATAEISRVQLWQWRKHQAEMRSIILDGHLKLDDATMDWMIESAMTDLKGGQYEVAEKLFREMIFADECPEFLTLAAYDQLVAAGN